MLIHLLLLILLPHLRTLHPFLQQLMRMHVLHLSVHMKHV